MAEKTRLRVGANTALIAVCTMIPTILLHEVVSFGVMRDVIRWSDASCAAAGDCVGASLVIVGLVFVCLPVALIFAGTGAALARSALRRPIGLALWIVTCLWALFWVANGYRGMFGTTWMWHEPFLELMFHPIGTPLVIGAGAICFDMVLRRGAARRR